jgi:hypothetical protein
MEYVLLCEAGRAGRRPPADPRTAATALFNRISLIPQTSTTRMPQVGIGGSLVVESRKNGQLIRGIIWWNYLVGSTGFSRPPARPWPPHPARRPAPSAAATPRRTAELHLPPANGQNPVQKNGFYALVRIAPGDSTAQTTNVQGQRPSHIFRRCQQMAPHLAVAPLPRVQPRRHLR